MRFYNITTGGNASHKMSYLCNILFYLFLGLTRRLFIKNCLLFSIYLLISVTKSCIILDIVILLHLIYNYNIIYSIRRF